MERRANTRFQRTASLRSAAAETQTVSQPKENV